MQRLIEVKNLQNFIGTKFHVFKINKLTAQSEIDTLRREKEHLRQNNWYDNCDSIRALFILFCAGRYAKEMRS